MPITAALAGLAVPPCRVTKPGSGVSIGPGQATTATFTLGAVVQGSTGLSGGLQDFSLSLVDR